MSEPCVAGWDNVKTPWPVPCWNTRGFLYNDLKDKNLPNMFLHSATRTMLDGREHDARHRVLC